MSIETENWLKQETIKINQYVGSGSKNDLDRLKSKSKHIRMLLKLYFNNYYKMCEELDKYEGIFFTGMQLAYSEPSEFQKPDIKNQLWGHQSYIVLLKIRNFLEEEMQKLTKTN